MNLYASGSGGAGGGSRSQRRGRRIGRAIRAVGSVIGRGARNIFRRLGARGAFRAR